MAKQASEMYGPPGGADQLDDRLLNAWNDTIKTIFEDKSREPLYVDGEGDPDSPKLETPFFKLDPEAGRKPAVMAKWSPDPSSPVYCVGLEEARRLCDSGLVGRHELHAEYCEYQVVPREGRPKRVQVTTELREYWECVAMHDPDLLRAMAKKVLGFLPPWKDLYGGDPEKLTQAERRRRFAELVAGRGDLDDDVPGLEGVPVQPPPGTLNTDNLLFMTYPLNGLDDLLELLFFGARPWATQDGNGSARAAPAAIFASLAVPEFACRRSDPAVMAEATDAAFNGYKVTLADPPGISILGFPYEAFSYRGQPLPRHWVRPSRGRPGHWQRLEVGPPDREHAFLDDIFDITEQQPVTGGFQILRQLEIGVRLARWDPTPAAEIPVELTPQGPDPTPCSAENRCDAVKAALERLGAGTQPAPAVG
jgi:hypothetical protein